MAAETTASENSLAARLSYLKRDSRYASVKPYRLINVPATVEVPSTNVLVEEREVPVTEARGSDKGLTIDTNGFQLFSWPSDIDMNASYQDVDRYCKLMAEMLQEELGAEKVFIYEFRVSSGLAEVWMDHRGHLLRFDTIIVSDQGFALRTLCFFKTTQILQPNCFRGIQRRLYT